MTEKQKRFCDEYLIDCNATQAAIRAGYSKKTANEQGTRLLANVSLKQYIAKQLEEMHDSTIADGKEVTQYLTRVLRGESSAEVVVVEGQGDGYSTAITMSKAPDEREKLKAAELLGKRYGLFKENVNINGTTQIIIQEDLEDD